ncbi:MAG TPA: hypothetical protein PKM65_18070 [Spirochaetota bacterium]|nr:hypothetical protein [Spirochaetota bacterium]
MNGSIRSFERILERFRFREPVPDSVQAHILTTKRRSLIGILKSVDDYSITYGLVLAVYFTTRRMRIRPTVAQSKIILAALALTVLLVITFTIWLVTPQPAPRPDTLPQAAVSVTATATATIQQVQADEKMLDEKTAPSVRYRLGVETFTSDFVGVNERKRIADAITNELLRLAGPDRVVRIGVVGRKNVNRVLLGAVERLGDTYIITAKIVDVEKSRVLFSTSESAGTEQEIDTACERIARKAAGHVE